MSRSASFALLLAGVLAVGGGVGCAQGDKDSMSGSSGQSDLKMSGDTLYERLGGEAAISAVVDEFVRLAAADPKVNFTRKGHPNQWEPTPANEAKLKKGLVTFIAQHTGGPKAYKGKDMVSAHTGMEITDAEFDAIAANLIQALDKLKVRKKEKDELVAIVASTRGQMVGK